MNILERDHRVGVQDAIPYDSIGRNTGAPERLKCSKRTNNLAMALSIYTALRILAFSAAFPLFNNVDERLHLMSIQLYAEGRLPGRELTLMDPTLATSFLRYWSPEYGHSQEELYRHGINRPPQRIQTQTNESKQPLYAQKLQEWLRRPNYEEQSSPLYYIVAASWYKLGYVVGLNDWALLYWVRFLNAILYGLFVWLSWKFVETVYPEQLFLCLAVPALLAVFPQDVFFGMNRDVLSPVVCAAALLLMAYALATKAQSYLLLTASFLVGLAFLVEVSNFVLFGGMGVTSWIWVSRSPSSDRRKVGLVSSTAAAALLPPCLWMLRNYRVMGDLTGSAAKIRVLGWTRTSWQDIVHHPMFTWHGSSYFLVRLTENFWNGEYGWHGVRLRSPSSDWFYVFSSALMISLFIIDFVRRRRFIPELQRWAGSQALFLVASSVMFLATVSLVFNYPDNAYPSRLFPYLVSGRVISGALLPFALVYAIGLQAITNYMRKWVSPVTVLACILLFITVSDIRVRSTVFSSHFNFFALSGWTH
jgi:hypothetical protein